MASRDMNGEGLRRRARKFFFFFLARPLIRRVMEVRAGFHNPCA